MVPKILDYNNPGSLVNELRKRRFERFLSLIRPLPRPLTILDVGGEEYIWTAMGFGSDSSITVTLLNLYPIETSYPSFKSIVGDARAMACFDDKEFDVVFSNSVIEHVGGPDDMQRMAAEVERVGKSYFIQTPNRYFPIEPHFLFPFFQFLPLRLQVFLACHISLGYFKKFADPKEAKEEIRAIQLVSIADMRRFFPGAEILEERVAGLTKSLMACKGFGVNGSQKAALPKAR
jgi:hypothetical protein